MPAKRAAEPKPTADKPTGPDPTREVVNWVLAGHSEADIQDAIAKTWPGADAKPLIVAAVEKLIDAGKPDPGMIRGFAIEATREIFRKALEIGDHQVALRALKQLTELAGPT